MEARAESGRRTTDEASSGKQSGFGQVEDYLLQHAGPGRSGYGSSCSTRSTWVSGWPSKYKDATFERLKLLTQDVEAIQNIDQQLALFHQEMLRDFEPRLSRLDAAARRHGAAGHARSSRKPSASAGSRA